MPNTTKTIGSQTWRYDENNNRITIHDWRDEPACDAILATLEGCSDCSDCSGCSDLENATPVAEINNLMQIPVINNIHKELLDAVTSEGCHLNMGSWHTCETTHCRAGWIVTLAGEPGRALEAKTSTLFAAQQIYKKSGYPISPCRFFDSDEAAMVDMQRLAAAE